MMFRMSSTGRLSTSCCETVVFDATWSRGTIGFAAAVTVTPVSTTADDCIFTSTVMVLPPITRTPRTSAGA